MIRPLARTIEVVPTYRGNDKDKNPAKVCMKMLTAAEKAEFAAKQKKDKEPTDVEPFLLGFLSCSGIVDEKGKEVTTAEELCNLPGLSPVIAECDAKFLEANYFAGDQKNAHEPSSH